MLDFFYKGHITKDETFIRFINFGEHAVIDIPEKKFEFFKNKSIHHSSFTHMYCNFIYGNPRVDIEDPSLNAKYIKTICDDFIFYFFVKEEVDIKLVKKYIVYLNNFITGYLNSISNIIDIGACHIFKNGNIILMINTGAEKRAEVITKIQEKESKLHCSEVEEDLLSISLRYDDFSSFPHYEEYSKFFIDKQNNLFIDPNNIIYQIPKEFDTDNISIFNPTPSDYIFSTISDNNICHLLRSFYDEKNDELYEIFGNIPENINKLKTQTRYIINFVKNNFIINELLTSYIVPYFDYDKFILKLNLDYSLLPYNEDLLKDYIVKEFIESKDKYLYNVKMIFTETGIEFIGIC